MAAVLFSVVMRRVKSVLMNSALQSMATANYQQHSLLSTVNVLRSVIAAAAQVGNMLKP